MSKVWVLQHIRCETLGTIAQALAAANIRPQYVRPFAGQPIPKGMDGAAGLIVMGGPMGVYDHPRYPFLLDEMRLIGQALQEEKPVLGVCLGSQLLAATLGGTVTKGAKKEIGWYPVALTEPAKSNRLWVGIEPSFVAYHWHGDVFELPAGAVSLASSGLTACQAFRYRQNAYGFLFHMEVTATIIQDMVETFADELQEAGVDGRAIVREAMAHLPHLHDIGGPVFQRWANLVKVDPGD
ncbi:MAG: type 1 glutamine amidotransferase [Anaerolineae bacterium]|nr:type 1 glutamine amidotransferase [Anaerolineae bacterium]